MSCSLIQNSITSEATVSASYSSEVVGAGEGSGGGCGKGSGEGTVPPPQQNFLYIMVQ